MVFLLGRGSGRPRCGCIIVDDVVELVDDAIDTGREGRREAGSVSFSKYFALSRRRRDLLARLSW